MKVKKSVLNVCAVLSLLGCGAVWGADATLGQAGRLEEKPAGLFMAGKDHGGCGHLRECVNALK